MTLADVLVIVGGVIAIGLVVWWFFIAGDPGAARHEHPH